MFETVGQLLMGDTVLSGYGLDARASDYVVAAAEDVALDVLMANQVSAVMHYFYQVTFSWERCYRHRLMQPWCRPRHHSGSDDQRSQRKEAPHVTVGRCTN